MTLIFSFFSVKNGLNLKNTLFLSLIFSIRGKNHGKVGGEEFFTVDFQILKYYIPVNLVSEGVNLI